MPFAGQVAQQAVVEVFQVVQPLAQVRVPRLAQPRPVLGAHPLHRRLGGQAVADRFLERAVPAPIMGEHAVGLEHLVGGADQAMVALEHVVDLLLQRLDGGAQAQLLGRRVVAEQLLRRYRLFVQHHLAVGQAVGEPRALQPLGPVRRDLDVLQDFLAEQLAGADHLGQHHGDDLQVLDLFLAVAALGAVLDDEDADRPPAAQQRHAEE